MFFGTRSNRGAQSRMRRAACLALALLTALLASAQAAERGDLLAVRNCEAWVSLREGPDSGARQMEKVPLDALVRFVSEAGSGFSKVQYGEETGYVDSSYLEPTGLAMCVAEDADGLPLYKGAPGSEFYTELPAGEILLCTGDAGGGYLQVNAGLWSDGAVDSRSLRAADPQKALRLRVSDVDASAPLHSGADRDSEILRQLPAGAEVAYLGNTRTGMAYVCCDGLYGFVDMRRLDPLQRGVKGVDLERIGRFPRIRFEGEPSSAVYLKRGKIHVYDSADQIARKVGVIHAPSVFLSGDSTGIRLGSPLRDAEKYIYFTRVAWWDPASNAVKTGYVPDSALNGGAAEILPATAWDLEIGNCIAKVMAAESALRAGPRSDALELAKLQRDAYLYVLGMSEDEWLYVSNRPFNERMNAAPNAGPQREGWIAAVDVGILGKLP